MRNENLKRAIVAVLLQSVVFTTMTFGQHVAKSAADTRGQIAASTASYLFEVTATADLTNERISRRIADLLAAPAGKNAVLIDEHGYARDGVLQGVANRLNAGGKRVYRVDWNALYSNVRDEAALAVEFNRIAAFVSRQNAVLYVDDLAGFSVANPMFGPAVARSLTSAVVRGKMRVLTASSENEFSSISDAKLVSRFEKIELGRQSGDDFVGDKISPDLRELMAGADRDRTVKVILQSDDIGDPQLLSVLRRNECHDRRTSHRARDACN